MRHARPIEMNLDNLRLVSECLKNIPHFLFFGTLLGYVREGCIIEGDDDIDLYVDRTLRNEISHLFHGTDMKVRRNREKFQTEYFAQAVRRFDDVVTFADFYFYEDTPEHDYIVDHWNFRGEYRNPETAMHVPRELLFPLQKGTMQGFEVSLPANPEGCCEFLYGKDWRIPMAKGSEYTTKIVDHRPRIVLQKNQ